MRCTLNMTFLVVLLLAIWACRKSKGIVQPVPIGDTTVHESPGRGDTLPNDPRNGSDTTATDPAKDPANGDPPPDPAPPPPVPYLIDTRTFALSENIGGLYAYRPALYDSEPDKKYPLLIFLHGGGERGNGGNELSRLSKQSIPNLMSRNRFPSSFTSGGEEFSFVIICPQFQTESWPTPADVDAAVEHGLKNYRVDPSRVYLVGLSMGGGAAWNYATRNARKLAAIVPICGASWPAAADIEKLAATKLPIWAFHNKDDQVVSYYSTTAEYYTGLKNLDASYPIRLTLWETGGHDAWTRASDPGYRENGMNIYEWLLQYRIN